MTQSINKAKDMLPKVLLHDRSAQLKVCRVKLHHVVTVPDGHTEG